MTAALTLAAVAATLLGLAYFTATDPKRRRAFKLPPRRRRVVLPACILVLAPGVLLLVFGRGAGFVIWLGAATVLGWLMAARAPASNALSKSDRESRVGK